MKTRTNFSAFAAALSLVAVSAATPAAVAQDKMGGKMKPGAMQSGKRMGQMVYTCKGCKMYYSEADARKMKMMDPMGHKLMRMSMADAKKMGLKMGTMHGKMRHDKKMGGGRM